MEHLKINFGELSADTDLRTRVTDFHDSLENVGNILDQFCALDVYDSLCPEDKVRYDLFQSFAINSLYWLYLRTQGIDPNQHELKSEINRVKEYMSKSKKLHERKTIMPRIDQEAAKRFIRSGLWTPNDTNASHSTEAPQAKKRKRDDDDDDDDDHNS